MKVSRELSVVPPDHYAYVTRRAMHLLSVGELPNVLSIDVEPKYGYTTMINYIDGSHRITFGNDLGLNPGASEDLAKDKGHTKFMLRTLGVNCPDGEEFLLPWWVNTIGESQRRRGNKTMLTVDKALEYVQTTTGFPVYVKPVAGSKGIGVKRVEDEHELYTALDELEEARSRVAVIEEAVNLPDYRIVALDGELISAYQRVPLQVVGDGVASIAELLQGLQKRYESDGRDTTLHMDDPRHATLLKRLGYTHSSVPTEGEVVVLADISNLSAGGSSIDVTSALHNRWTELTAYVAKNLNLRLIGLDLACSDITDPDAEYSVLEVNSTPGLDHYAASGAEQEQAVDALYAKVLNALPL